MKLLKAGVLLLTLLLMASCGSSGPSTKDDVKKLKTFSSYAYLPNKDTIIDRDLDNVAINETIIETINANMREHGFQLDKLQPDVLIYVHAMYDEQVAVNANPVYTNYSYYRPGFFIGPYYRDFMYENYFTIQRIDGPRVKQVPYRERSIVIDFIDRRSKEILWRGALDETIGKKRLERETREYIDDIFRELY